MSVFGEWRRRLWFLINRRRLDEALRQDMEAHREMLGRPERFGRMLSLREESRDVWGWRWWDELTQDVRFAVRTLLRSPGFAATAVLTLALATGATTAIFSIINGVLLRPLPFAEPDRLVQINGRNWREDRPGEVDPVTGPVTSHEIEAFARSSRTVEALAGYSVTTVHLDRPGGRERLAAVRADSSFFTVLGVPAMLGRTFRDGDPPDVGVVSAGLWRDRFGSDPGLAGRTVVIENRSVTVLGVMPDTFQFPYSASSLLPGSLPESRTEVWLPLPPPAPASGEPQRRGRLSVIGRLAQEATVAAAHAELRLIAGRVERELYSGTKTRVDARVRPLIEVVLGPVQRSLWMLFAAVGLVLAAACANVANLLLARMTVRTREVVTRAALGAGRLRLARQFLAESIVLALAGGLVGVLIARWSSGVLAAQLAARIPRAHEIGLDWQAFVFLLLACLVTAILFGLAPALTAARLDILSVTKTGGSGTTMGRLYGRLRDALVVVEVALAFVLATGAAILIGELVRLQRLDAGMETENVLTLHVGPRTTPQDYYAIEARAQQVPGVRGAGLIQLMPLQSWGWVAGFTIHGRPADERPTCELRYVTPGYFAALGVPIVAGRGFQDGDVDGAPRVILINQSLARRYFPREDPVGRELDRGTIVGVVGDVRQAGLDRGVEPVVFYPVAQNVATVPDLGMTLVVRTDRVPEALTDSLRSAIREVNPTLAVFNVKTMEQVVADSLWTLRLYRWLIGAFAGLALLLAAIGLYGVVSYGVSTQLREFAVRLALGSNPRRLWALVVGRGGRLVALGLVAGLLMAIVLGPTLQGLSTTLRAGPATYAAVAVLLVTLALAACLVPARRAARVNPFSVLRHE